MDADARIPRDMKKEWKWFTNKCYAHLRIVILCLSCSDPVSFHLYLMCFLPCALSSSSYFFFSFSFFFCSFPSHHRALSSLSSSYFFPASKLDSFAPLILSLSSFQIYCHYLNLFSLLFNIKNIRYLAKLIQFCKV